MKRFKHSLSNYKLTTGNMGQLIPVQLQEMLPGDSIRASSAALIRVSPQLAPVMHPVTVRLHHWFVPHRLTFSGWEDFITGGPDGDDNTLIPQISVSGTNYGSIIDHLGIPPEGLTNFDISALPVRCYNLIFNEFYRDQDLVTERDLDDIEMAYVAWAKDYMTTARPFPQKGPDITIPLGDTAPVIAQGIADGERQEYGVQNEQIYADTDPSYNGPFLADLTNATAANVNDWRRAFALQRYQEARAQYGSRYSEYLQYLGVNPADSRLQRPEYLGGGKATVNFSEVLQTGPDPAGGEDTYVGELKGHGIAAVRTKNLVRHFNEHGYMLTLMSVVPKAIYQDGIARTWLRSTKEDFWQRELQQIGQQPVYNNEVYADDTNGAETFGYQDRYAEYKSTQSTVGGNFRSLLDFWHMARKFETPPALNEEFIKCDPTRRIFAEQTTNTLWCMIQNNVRARRLVRKSATSRIL